MTARKRPAVPSPTADQLQRHALRVAIAEGRLDQAQRARDGARAAAEIVFAEARKKGPKTEAVILPDGAEVGTISIYAGETVYTVDEELLLAIAAGNDPGDVEDYLLPGAERDPDVIALITKHHPEWIGARIRPAVRKQYQDELEENDGTVTNRRNGEREEVATVTRHDPSGRFSYRPKPKAWMALEEAIQLGHLTEDGEVTDPEAGPPADGAGAAETAEETSAKPVADDSLPE